MKTTKDSDLSLLLIFQQSDKLLTRSQSRKKKNHFLIIFQTLQLENPSEQKGEPLTYFILSSTSLSLNSLM